MSLPLPPLPSGLLTVLLTSLAAGDLNADSMTPREFAQAVTNEAGFARIQAEAKRGDASAMLAMGYVWFEGRRGVVEPSPKEAVRWITRAAAAGRSDAQFLQGLALAEGYGAPKNPEAAASAISKAAAQGHLPAHQWLGLTYFRGSWGITQDIAKAVPHLEVAAQDKDKDVLYALSLAFFNGAPGVERDLSRGYTNLVRAAEAGHVRAHFLLGSILEKMGRLEDAHECFRIASAEEPLAEVERLRIEAKLIGQRMQQDQERFDRQHRRFMEVLTRGPGF